MVGCGRLLGVKRSVSANFRPEASHVRLAKDGIPAHLMLSENLGETMLLNTELAGGQIVKLRLPEVRRFTPAKCSP
jgi:hypothetical protein